MITTKKLLEIKSLSEKATQGKIVGPQWTEDVESRYGYYLEEDDGHTLLGDYSRKEDAIFAVAANPTSIKVMIEELIEARKVIEFYANQLNWSFKDTDFIGGYGRPVILLDDCSYTVPVPDYDCLFGGKRARAHLSKFSRDEL